MCNIYIHFPIEQKTIKQDVKSASSHIFPTHPNIATARFTDSDVYERYMTFREDVALHLSACGWTV